MRWFVPPVVAPVASKLHKTYGVYLSGEWKRNAVRTEDLEEHIAYNKSARGGRALIVDGVVVHRGYFSQEAIEAFVRDRLPDIDRDWRPTQDSRPYH